MKIIGRRRGRCRSLSAIRIRDNSRSLKEISAMQTGCSASFPGRGRGGKEIGWWEIGRDGMEIHFLNGDWSTVYLTVIKQVLPLSLSLLITQYDIRDAIQKRSRLDNYAGCCYYVTFTITLLNAQCQVLPNVNRHCSY